MLALGLYIRIQDMTAVLRILWVHLAYLGFVAELAGSPQALLVCRSGTLTRNRLDSYYYLRHYP